MAPLSEQEMKKWRAVAGLNIILGAIVAIVQVATLISLHELVDWFGIGIWGGVFMISAGTLTIRRNPRLIFMSICALLSGVALIIFYALILGVYINRGYYCYYADDSLCDWRMASDIIFIVCGCLALIVNLLLTINSEEIVIVQPIVLYPFNNVYPISTTNTTYMATSNQHPAGYQQTVNQVPVVTDPSNNTNNGVSYQTSPPGYPPVNNNQQQQQQQPVYYIQTSNPPAYSATTNVY
ncbi:uncharacterized protein LOC124326479 isoform X5 [Daphnia pulicaria]|uniref:uncharacterized protein LOC124326479 isoform X5 n=1 Tax=Daphnia pulicaria TaxID=35523 RepID=UPI001EEB820B|nr:uncharacterized protein LOC124326479 isoform X5 [Daphnia pulicaria]